MGTLAEEIFSKKVGREVTAGEVVWADVDYMMSHDSLCELTIQAMEQITAKPKFPNRIVIPFDHIVPPANIEHAKTQRKIMDFVKKHNLPNFFQEGVCHQLMIEKGFAMPGTVVIGSDSHTCSYGALGCFGTGMGSTDVGVAFATGKSWFRIPESFLINVKGRFTKGVYPKDLILWIIATLDVDGANYKSLEYAGETISAMTISQRITLSNMAVECGAKAGLIEPDDKTVEFLKGMAHAKYQLVKAVDGKYERKLDFDVGNLEPQVACPHDLNVLKPIGDVKGTDIQEVFIGTCTNGRYDDLEIAAHIMKGKRVSRFTRTIIIPASVSIFNQAMEAGLIKIFHDAGCIVCNPGCGPCIGRHEGTLAPGEAAFTTMNRNFKGRMGSPDSEIYVGSPATAAATALKGKIADPREVL
ncbi:MAG: 3-isopropylmalate dehydratase large subunit [Candidatus Woesearchaeota archaeon]